MLSRRWFSAALFAAVLCLPLSVSAQLWPYIAIQPAAAPTLHYVEATVTETNNNGFGGGGWTACLGLAGTGFNRANPHPLDVNINPVPGLANGLFYGFTVGTGSDGWGYVTRLPGGVPLVALGDVVGMAWDDASSQVWFQNATQAPGTWYGDGTAFTPDPVTKVHGFTYSDPSGMAAISGPAYILVGAGYTSGKPAAQLTLNTTGPFVAAPTGYVGAGGAINPLTVNGSDLVITNFDLTMTAGVIMGMNQPSSFAIGTVGFAH